MFALNDAKTKLVSDETPINQSRPDPSQRPGLKPEAIKNIIIHAIQQSSMQVAVEDFLSSARSLHLLIERDGKEIVQMVDFDHLAVHANEYDNSSLGIGLIYPGYLTEKPGFFYSKNRFDPLDLLFAQSINDNKKRWYSFYPQEQLDTLLEICRLLVNNFGIERILTRQEINKLDLTVGPAFPINRLRQLIQGEGTRSELPEITSATPDLFQEPGEVGLKLLDQPFPADTPIAVTDEDEDGGSVLVELMAPLGERRWTVGWIDAGKVAVKPFEPKVNDDHLLVTQDNRRIKFMAAHEKNFNPNSNLDPRYVIIHFTTGTNMMQTVHTFLNPESGVSSHLLVGREGRVVQFVPFNKIAFHAGQSTWEGETNLNRFAIGIEVDNAGFLRTTPKGFKRKNKLIPIEQVKSKKHWKEDFVRPWQTFTDEQVQVVRKIVQALREQYPTIQEIVGHDMVNLVNRLDPGPFYPLGELREAILGSPQPPIVAYQALDPADENKQEFPIYRNFGNRPPHVVPHPDFGELPEKSTVRVKQVYEAWTLVVVKECTKGSLVDKVGWVLSNTIAPVDGKAKTKAAQTFYQVIPASEARLPPLELDISPMTKGSQVRIQFTEGDDWALVAPLLEVRKDADGRYEMVVPEDKVPKNFIEGWMERRFLEKIEPPA
jgi:N-acetyl-anhydromuramyl-L-alanine amidase AmpD